MKKIKPKTILVNIVITIVLSTVYVALTEHFTWENIAVGLGVAIAALWLTNKFFLTEPYHRAFTLNGRYFVFAAYLLYIIMKSAAVSLAYIFTKDIGVNLIPFQTSLKDDNLKAMLCNAISLTPGTVTAEVSGDTIEVMKLCKLCKLDQTSGFVRIEKLLLAMERNKKA